MKHLAVRKLTYYLFIVAFLIAAPLLVLYTYGYRWSPDSGVARTGTLFLVTTPRDADIYIDGNRYKDGTPSIVKWLSPGAKTVRLEKDGYLPWEKTLPIERTRTTFADDVQLFLTDSQQPLVLDTVVAIAWSPDDTSMVYATSARGWTEIWLSPISRPRARLISRVPSTQAPILTWQENNQIRVELEDDTTVLYATDGTIVEPTETVATLQLITTEAAVLLQEEDRVIATLPLGDYRIHSERGDYILLEQPATSSLTLFNRRNTDDPIVFTTTGTTATWYGDEQLLLASRWEIQLFTIADSTLTSILRQSEPVHSVQWHPSGHYVFYGTQTGIYSIELDSRGDGRQWHEIAVRPRIDSFNIDARGRELYIAGATEVDEGIFIRPLR